jgi:hypothetical protein
MRRAKNAGVILTCKVGASMPMRTKKPPAAKRCFLRGIYVCKDGPYVGRRIQLDTSGDLKTLTIRVRGQVGRYFGDNWVPAPL